MNEFNKTVDFTTRHQPRRDDETQISTINFDGHYRVLVDGRIARTFYGPDAERKAKGYALALLDERPIQPQQV